MSGQIATAAAAVVMGAVALILGLLSIPSTQTTPQAPGGPATLDFSVIITGVGAVGESKHHFFSPSMITVRRGDTVRLRVMNLTLAAHGFQIDGYNVRSGRLPGGPKGVETFTFVADKGGVFKFQCNVPYNPTTGDCSPDHDTQIGYLVVLDPPR